VQSLHIFSAIPCAYQGQPQGSKCVYSVQGTFTEVHRSNQKVGQGKPTQIPKGIGQIKKRHLHEEQTWYKSIQHEVPKDANANEGFRGPQGEV
jgi:hypothetical protein